MFPSSITPIVSTQQNTGIPPPPPYSQHGNISLSLNNSMPTMSGIRPTTSVGNGSSDSSMAMMSNSSFPGVNSTGINTSINQQQMLSQPQSTGVMGMGTNTDDIMTGNMSNMHSTQPIIGSNNTGFLPGNHFRAGMGINSSASHMYLHQMQGSSLADSNMMNSGNVNIPGSIAHHVTNSLPNNLMDPSSAVAFQAQIARQQHAMKMAANQQQQQPHFNG